MLIMIEKKFEYLHLRKDKQFSCQTRKYLISKCLPIRKENCFLFIIFTNTRKRDKKIINSWFVFHVNFAKSIL